MLAEETVYSINISRNKNKKMNEFRTVATVLALIAGCCLFAISFFVTPDTGVALLRFAVAAVCFALALKPCDE